MIYYKNILMNKIKSLSFYVGSLTSTRNKEFHNI